MHLYSAISPDLIQMVRALSDHQTEVYIDFGVENSCKMAIAIVQDKNTSIITGLDNTKSIHQLMLWDSIIDELIDHIDARKLSFIYDKAQYAVFAAEGRKLIHNSGSLTLELPLENNIDVSSNLNSNGVLNCYTAIYSELAEVNAQIYSQWFVVAAKSMIGAMLRMSHPNFEQEVLEFFQNAS